MDRRLIDVAYGIGHRYRQRRFLLVRQMLESLPRPLRIVDIGGSQWFWEQMGYVDQNGVSIVIVNLDRYETTRAGLTGVEGDARDLSMFGDGAFDVAFSNSLIEHVGSWEDQRATAREIARVGRRYIVQTPNRGFPIEPHYMFPLFQFLPLSTRLGLIRTLHLGLPEAQNPEYVAAVRLLTESEMLALFPGCRLLREKALGMTKSLTAVGGFPVAP